MEFFCYEVMLFGLYNVVVAFQRLMNKVLELYLEYFVKVVMDIFEFYRDWPLI